MAAVGLVLACGKKKDDGDNTPTPTPSPTATPQGCEAPDTLSTETNSAGGTFYRGSGTIDPAGDIDYYTFDVSAGDWVGLIVSANPDGDPGLLDSVITLYDETGATQLAGNDDSVTSGSVDSELYYHSTEDQTLCVSITDYSDEGDSAFTYDLAVLPIDFDLYDEFNEDTEPNDDTAAAQTLTTTDAGTDQVFTRVAGILDSDTDADVYQFDTPANTAAATWSFTPSDTDGYGSTSSTGIVRIYDSDETTVLAELDQQAGSSGFFLPLAPTTTYYVEVNAPAGGALGSNPFYVQNLVTSTTINPQEMDDTANNDAATAEVATPIAGNGIVSHYIGGTLSGASDTDWWSFDATAGDSIALACSSWRIGSGVRDATVSVFEDPMGSALQTETENEAEDLLWSDTTTATMSPVPVSTTATHYFRIEASTFDATVTGRYYSCGIHVLSP